MVNIDYFNIVLKKQSAIYFAGETVTGAVNFRIRERLKVNCVFIIAEGQGIVQWTEYRGTGKQRNVQTYRKHESYFKVKIVLADKQGVNDLYLEVGDHTLPFQVTIPHNVPTSFEHVHGRIRYSLKSSIDIPWAIDKHTYKGLSVINHVDLNQNPALRQPYHTTETKTLCCLCCKSGPITATMSLRKTGFVCGEFLAATITFENKSSRDIKNPVMYMYEHIRLHASRKTKSSIRKLCAFGLPKLIKANSSEKFDSIGFVVPAVCPTLTSSKVIQITYYLDLNFDAAGPSVSSDMKVPLVIGTIPIGHLGPQVTNQISFQPYHFGTVASRELEKSEGGQGSDPFLPQYPFYKDFSIQSHSSKY